MTSEEGQAWGRWYKQQQIEPDYHATFVWEDGERFAELICHAANEEAADQIIADHAAARERESLEARLNAAIEGSSIAEYGRLKAEARIRELEALIQRVPEFGPHIWDGQRQWLEDKNALLSQGAGKASVEPDA